MKPMAAKGELGSIEEPGSGLQLALGATLDGVPESVAIGLTLLGGNPVSIAFVIAVFLSNVPEGMARLSRTGSHRIFKGADPRDLGWCRGFVRGRSSGWLRRTRHFTTKHDCAHPIVCRRSILAMLAITMMPQAFTKGGRAVGIVTVIGFILAAGLSAH